jgi:hypothetical protein
VKEDGSRTKQDISFDQSVSASSASNPSNIADGVDDTLTKRSSPSAVTVAVQNLKDQCEARDVLEQHAVTSQDANRIAGQHNERDDSLSARAQEGMCKSSVESSHCRQSQVDLSNILSSPGDLGPLLENILSNPDEATVKEREIPWEVERGPKHADTLRASSGLQPEEKYFNEPMKAQPAEDSKSTLPSPCISRTLEDLEERATWRVGTVLEVFSASNKRWFPALVTQVMRTKTSKDMLVAQFWLTIEEAKQKTIERNSDQLASLGTNCGDQLPPGFQIGASKSRPGMFVFLDATTGLKYESLELIWAVHFKRWLDHPLAEGTETISSVAAPVKSTNMATVELPAGGEMAGLVTRVALDKLPESAEPCAAPDCAVAAGDPGFGDDLDAWAPWMTWSAPPSEPQTLAPEVALPAERPVESAVGPAIEQLSHDLCFAPSEDFDPWAPWKGSSEDAHGDPHVVIKVRAAPDQACDDENADLPEDELVARLPEPTTTQSPKRMLISG